MQTRALLLGWVMALVLACKQESGPSLATRQAESQSPTNQGLHLVDEYTPRVRNSPQDVVRNSQVTISVAKPDTAFNAKAFARLSSSPDYLRIDSCVASSSSSSTPEDCQSTFTVANPADISCAVANPADYKIKVFACNDSTANSKWSCAQVGKSSYPLSVDSKSQLGVAKLKELCVIDTKIRALGYRLYQNYSEFMTWLQKQQSAHVSQTQLHNCLQASRVYEDMGHIRFGEFLITAGPQLIQNAEEAVAGERTRVADEKSPAIAAKEKDLSATADAAEAEQGGGKTSHKSKAVGLRVLESFARGQLIAAALTAAALGVILIGKGSKAISEGRKQRRQQLDSDVDDTMTETLDKNPRTPTGSSDDNLDREEDDFEDTNNFEDDTDKGPPETEHFDSKRTAREIRKGKFKIAGGLLMTVGGLALGTLAIKQSFDLADKEEEWLPELKISRCQTKEISEGLSQLDLLLEKRQKLASNKDRQ